MAQTRSTRATQRRSLEKETLVYCPPRAIRYSPGSQLSRICTQMHRSTTTPYTQGFRLRYRHSRRRLGSPWGRSNERGSTTSQACYGHPRCATSTLSVSSASLFLCRFSDAFSSSLTHAVINLQPLPLHTVLYKPNLRVECGSSAPVPRDAK